MNDLQKFLKCFYVIKKYEDCEDCSEIERDEFCIEEYLSFLLDIAASCRCSTKGDYSYCMGNVIAELIDRLKIIKKRKSDDSFVKFYYTCNGLEKIFVKSKDYKNVITSIVNHFDKDIEVFFKIDE